MRRGAKPSKARVESKIPVAPKSRKNEGSRVRDLEKRLAEALQREAGAVKREAETQEQQTATAEILRVISASPSDVSPVFRAIVRSAIRLCDATFGTVFRFDGELITVAANQDLTPEEIAITNTIYPAPATRGIASGRAIVDRAVVHISDIRNDPDYVARAPVNALGYRTALAVPMLREGSPIGVFVMWRREVRPFTDKQIELLETFADQAVIAIENVRLFKELQASNSELMEALEQQTATSEILRVMSRAQMDVQPIFETIVRSAALLCDAARGGLVLIEGDRLCLASAYPQTPESVELMRRHYPRPVDTTSLIGHAILERRVVHVPDLESPDVPPLVISATRQLGFRSYLTVPMLRDGQPIGAIAVSRLKPGAFSDKQIELLKTFADQAVIAIENVRLFKELEAKNRDLTEALDRQTATSEILRAISRAQTDVQPVFDVIAASALRLCDGVASFVFRHDGTLIHLAAFDSAEGVDLQPLRHIFPAPPERGTFAGRVVATARLLYIADIEHDRDAPPTLVEFARANGFRSIFATPMLRDGHTIGVIAVTHRDVDAFTPKQGALLETFADQAVIAIENVRLFKELEARTQELTRSVSELRALGEVGQAISSTLDLQTVLSTIVARATQLTGVDAGVIYEYDEQREVFEPRATERLEGDIVQMLVATPVRKGQGATGRLAEVLEPIQLSDLRDTPEQIPVRDLLLRAGYRALLAVPLVREDHLIGGLTVFRKTPGEFAPEVVELLKTFATQSALAIQNARLFLEIEDKSRQLEVASQHKSEFLANMSHELRTPLNAIIGFSEVLTERMFGELNEKQAEYLKDIYASGTHLLSLINDILDLSKIEAGRMELELTDFDLPQAIDNALILVRERAGRRGIALEHSVAERLGEIRGDERKIKQVLLNLLSNALKFTPESGRVEVRARVVDGMAEISVTDTGVGIAPEDQEAVFEEFRQVGTSAAKQEGTGLGLALCRKFVELHGGKIGVTSQVGVGSTFTFTLPLRR